MLCKEHYFFRRVVKMSLKKLSGVFIVMLLSASFPLYAEEEEKAEDEATSEESAETATPAPAIYLPIRPAFVVNYGGAGRLKYLKTELSVRVAHTDAANSVRHHLPLIRNNLVMLFARQTDETVNSQEGRELMRQEALEEIRKVALEEDGQEGIIDVFFNTFIVQN